MRVREKDVSGSSVTKHEAWYLDSSPYFINDVTWQNKVHHVRMADYSVANFTSLQKKGNLFFNPMGKIILDLSGDPVTITGKAKQGSSWQHGTFMPRGTPIPLLGPPGLAGPLEDTYTLVVDYLSTNAPAGVRDSAITEAWANTDQTILAALASLGEGKETLEYIALLLRRLAKLLRSFRSKKGFLGGGGIPTLRKIDPSKLPSKGADLWMELRYALRPLLYELKNALELLNASLNRKMRLTARGFETWSKTETSNDPLVFNQYARVEYLTTKKISYYCRPGLLYGFRGDVGYFELLGLDKPISAGYELVFLSFVLDWFTNLGSFITAWEANSSIVVLGSWITEQLTVEHNATPTGLWHCWETLGLTDIELTISGGMWTSTSVAMQRTSTAGIPPLPSIRINLDWTKILDLAIICKGLLKANLK